MLFLLWIFFPSVLYSPTYFYTHIKKWTDTKKFILHLTGSTWHITKTIKSNQVRTFIFHLNFSLIHLLYTFLKYRPHIFIFLPSKCRTAFIELVASQTSWPVGSTSIWNTNIIIFFLQKLVILLGSTAHAPNFWIFLTHCFKHLKYNVFLFL